MFFSAKASDPLEAFKHEIAAVEADETAATAVDEAAAPDRTATPDELEFEDDDGTLYTWDPLLRKYVPAAAADGATAADNVQQQQQQQLGDYDIEAMTFVEEQEVIPTLAAARAAEAAADAAANGADRQPGRDGKKVSRRGRQGTTAHCSMQRLGQGPAVCIVVCQASHHCLWLPRHGGPQRSDVQQLAPGPACLTSTPQYHMCFVLLAPDVACGTHLDMYISLFCHCHVTVCHALQRAADAGNAQQGKKARNSAEADAAAGSGGPADAPPAADAAAAGGSWQLRCCARSGLSLSALLQQYQHGLLMFAP